jgi:hypothetical protein
MCKSKKINQFLYRPRQALRVVSGLSSDPPTSQGILWGWEAGVEDNREDKSNRSYRKQPHLVFQQSTHTSCPLPRYFERVWWLSSCFPLITRYQIQSQAGSP